MPVRTSFRERRSSRSRRALALFHRRLARRDLFLHFLRGLPKEKIGRDGGSEDTHQRSPIRAGPLHGWNQGGAQHGRPVRMRQKRGGDVGEQGESEPLEDPGDEPVTGPEQQADQNERIDGRPIERPDAGEKLRDVGHAAEIRGDIEDIGDDQQRTGAPQDPAWIAQPDHAGQPEPGDHAEAGAHDLHRRHQREREHRGPQRRIAETGAGDRISGDAGWVVIGGAGDQAGAEIGKEPAEPALQDENAPGSFGARRFLAQ